jgi:hypothetical protein
MRLEAVLLVRPRAMDVVFGGVLPFEIATASPTTIHVLYDAIVR